ncbi:MAG: delta 1-pyrroline-5-carboxylate synthetase [Methanobacteriaceae archaeon]|nr:delta 1-pyrroline-5-carboxylate synthetase [Methanobacteriaceae archaeon]
MIKLTTVIKIGGSLFPKYSHLICEKLKEIDEDILIISGGGEFANTIRRYNKKYHYSDDANHWAAINCMDITGRLLADKHEHIKIVTSLNEIKKVQKEGYIPLLLVSDMLHEHDILKHSWEVTSDSISVWVAHILNAKLLILTNVDGIYIGNISPKNNIIENIYAKKLLLLNKLPVDKCLPKLLIKYHLNCSITNGKQLDRVLSVMNNDNKFKYTKIIGE